MSRQRSPNYPAIGLGTAIEKIRAVQKNEGQNSVSRNALAKDVGFGSLNGGSAMILSALGKYGLLENTKEGEARVTDLALDILFGEPHERVVAVAAAGLRPSIFKQLQEKWPGAPPSDESMNSFLRKEGFTEAAAGQVIQFYREIIDIAKPTGSVQPKPASTQKDDPVTTPQAETAAHQPPTPPPPALNPQRPFTLGFDGSVVTGTLSLRSVRDIDRLIKVLDAQKAALEAMQDDQEQGDDDRRN